MDELISKKDNLDRDGNKQRDQKEEENETNSEYLSKQKEIQKLNEEIN